MQLFADFIEANYMSKNPRGAIKIASLRTSPLVSNFGSDYHTTTRIVVPHPLLNRNAALVRRRDVPDEY